MGFQEKLSNLSEAPIQRDGGQETTKDKSCIEARFSNTLKPPVTADGETVIGPELRQDQDVSQAFFKATFADAGGIRGAFMHLTRPDAQIRSSLPSSSSLRPSAFGGQGRPLSELPAKVQEDIKALGDHLPNNETGKEPLLVGIMPTCPTVINGETNVTDDDERLIWKPVPGAKQQIADTMKPNMYSEVGSKPKLPFSPFPPRPKLNVDPGIPRPENPVKTFRMALVPARNVTGTSIEDPSGWTPKDCAGSSMQVSIPVPPPLNQCQIEDIIDRKVERLREDFKHDLECARGSLEQRNAEVDHKNNRITELGIRLKISKDQKEEYKKEIRKLQEKMTMLKKE